MSEHPILFSAEMVRAILDGKKTQTRRTRGLEDVNIASDLWKLFKIGELGYMTKKRYQGRFGAYFHSEEIEERTLAICPAVCPYGQPDDLLWVRETHYRFGHWVKNGFTATGKQRYKFIPETQEVLFYDNPPEKLANGKSKDIHGWYKRPSIFMPKWATRIWLRVKSVRVERVQDISDADAIAEGVAILDIDTIGRKVYPDYQVPKGFLWQSHNQYYSAKQSFMTLWDSINEKRGYGWDANPWVWVVEFEKVKG